MRIVRHPSGFHVYLQPWEKQQLFDLFKLYPQIPPGHFRLTKSGVPNSEANQQLLEEALAEQRSVRKQQILAMIAEPQRWEETPHSLRIRFSEGELEGLLQVLNDIRVGLWVKLGSPETLPDPENLDPKNAPFHLYGELAAAFESLLVRALSRPKP